MRHKRRRRFNVVGFVVRMFFLCLLLAASLMLYRWSLTDDPLFYRFLNSASGRALAKTFHWYRFLPDQPVSEKPVSQMTKLELATKAELEKELAAIAPVHRLLLKNGQRIDGHVLSQGSNYVLFSESYGDSGMMSIRISRDRVREIETIGNAVPAVSYRDVRFQIEFPMTKLYKWPPYVIQTDQPFFSVRHYVEALQHLHEQFMQTFGVLRTRFDQENDIQVLFFARESEYRQYEQRYSRETRLSSGFYSPWVDRLIVFDQSSIQQIQGLRRNLAQREEQYTAAGGASDDQARRIHAQDETIDREITSYAEAQTLSTIRHEGAHQLFFGLGIHSPYRIENDWLVEGLATYCEPPRMGDRDPFRVHRLKDAQSRYLLIPIDFLVNFRNQDGFMAFWRPEQVELAYSESWALVHFLMQPERRTKFFLYIRYIRDPANFWEARRGPAFDLLARFLDTKPELLAIEWLDYVAKL